MDKIHKFKIADPDWGETHIITPVCKNGDIWGEFKILQGTFWEQFIPTVSAENLSHALHGNALPLLRELGNPPEAILKKIPKEHGVCKNKLLKTCLFVKPYCKPCNRVPDCYEPPNIENPELSLLVTELVLAWRDGIYVILVEGEEFVLRGV